MQFTPSAITTTNLLPAFLGCILVTAALWDLRFQKIPNLITYPTMLASLCFHGVTHGASGVLFSLAGLATGIAALVVFYLLGGMGAGDVKLLGAVGAALGPAGALNAFVFTALAGGLYAAAVLLLHSGGWRTLAVRSLLTRSASATLGAVRDLPASRRHQLPKLSYGLAIAGGTLGALWWLSAYGSFPIDWSCS